METTIVVLAIIVMMFFGLLRLIFEGNSRYKAVTKNYPQLIKSYQEYLKDSEAFSNERVVALYNCFRDTCEVYETIEKVSKSHRDADKALQAGTIVAFCRNAGSEIYKDIRHRGLDLPKKTSDYKSEVFLS